MVSETINKFLAWVIKVAGATVCLGEADGDALLVGIGRGEVNSNPTIT